MPLPLVVLLHLLALVGNEGESRFAHELELFIVEDSAQESLDLWVGIGELLDELFPAF